MLTAEQQAARAGKMTGGRVRIIAGGHPGEMHQLYLEMIGEAVEDNLDDVWPVQRGLATEPLNLRWYEKKSGHILTRMGEVAQHPYVYWAVATLDAWDPELRCPIECKDVGGNETWEVVANRYAPQLCWQMLCTGSSQCGFSVIMGGAEPRVDFFDYNADYGNKLFSLARMFMVCVKERRPPLELPPTPAPPAYDQRKDYDMSTSNEWGNHAGIWRDHRNSFKLCQQAEIELKKLVPTDARVCTGAGITVSVDRANRKHIREDTQ